MKVFVFTSIDCGMEDTTRAFSSQEACDRFTVKHLAEHYVATDFLTGNLEEDLKIVDMIYQNNDDDGWYYYSNYDLEVED